MHHTPSGCLNDLTKFFQSFARFWELVRHLLSLRGMGNNNELNLDEDALLQMLALLLSVEETGSSAAHETSQPPLFEKDSSIAVTKH